MIPKATRAVVVAIGVTTAGCAESAGPGIAPPPARSDAAALPQAAAPKNKGQRALVPSTQPALSLEGTSH